MAEKTLVKTMALPYGQDWAWFADANVVGLSDQLDAAGRERALTEVQVHWRRCCITLVPHQSRRPANHIVERRHDSEEEFTPIG